MDMTKNERQLGNKSKLEYDLLTSHQHWKTIATQLRLLKCFQHLTIPDESRVCSFQQAHFQEFRRHRVKPLQSMCDVVRVAEVYVRRIKHEANHGEKSFVVILLVCIEMEQRRNVRNNVDSGQSPNHLTVDESHREAMCCYH